MSTGDWGDEENLNTTSRSRGNLKVALYRLTQSCTYFFPRKRWETDLEAAPHLAPPFSIKRL